MTSPQRNLSHGTDKEGAVQCMFLQTPSKLTKLYEYMSLNTKAELFWRDITKRVSCKQN